MGLLIAEKAVKFISGLSGSQVAQGTVSRPSSSLMTSSLSFSCDRLVPSWPLDRSRYTGLLYELCIYTRAAN